MSQHLVTSEHVAVMDAAQHYSCLVPVALSILDRLQVDDCEVGMVCGPISTGGFGSIEANLHHFSKVISHLTQNHNLIIFDQIVFEAAIKRLKERLQPEGYDWRILYDFYLPIFRTGRITQKFFISGWENSIGTRWERAQAPLHGIKIFDLHEETLDPIW